MKKRVNIYPTRPITNVTPIIRGVVKDVTKDIKTIRLCILGMAKVEEILNDGSIIQLDLNNYNIDNNIEHPDANKDNNGEPAPVLPIDQQPDNSNNNAPAEPLDPNAVVPDETKDNEAPAEPSVDEVIEPEPAKEETVEEVSDKVGESTNAVSGPDDNTELVDETKDNEVPAEPSVDEIVEPVKEEVSEDNVEDDSSIDASEIDAISSELDSIEMEEEDPDDCEKDKDDEYGM